jgi:hypothetical protein
MNPQHRMTLNSDNGEELLFVCPHEECGRRLVLKRSGGLVVLDQGDFLALHSGGTEVLEISAGING